MSKSLSPDVQAKIAEAQKVYPVRVIKFCQDLGVQVYLDDVGPGVSGKICRDEKSPAGWSIYVNRHEPETRRRFTIAHEIGHYLLHADEMGNGVQDDVFYRSNLSSQQEVEANKFAADLLMPTESINHLLAHGISDVAKMATAFNVSPVAMSIRMGFPT